MSLATCSFPLVDVSISIFARLGAVVFFIPQSLFPIVGLTLFGGWLGQVYIQAQLSVKREMSAAKAPVLGILGGAIDGLRTFTRWLLCCDIADVSQSVYPRLQCSRGVQDRDRESCQ